MSYIVIQSLIEAFGAISDVLNQDLAALARKFDQYCADFNFTVGNIIHIPKIQLKVHSWDHILNQRHGLILSRRLLHFT